MNKRRKILILVIMLIVVAQVIQPTKNRSSEPSVNDISQVYTIPTTVQKTLVKKCYDCHSNNTNYPWYANVQPLGWWLAAHVHDGKEELNFSEFKTYTAKRAAHKLHELGEVIEDRSMPLKPYIWMHREAEITEEDEQAILSWIKSLGISEDHE